MSIPILTKKTLISCFLIVATTISAGETSINSIGQNPQKEWILLRHEKPFFQLGFYMPGNYTAKQLTHMADQLADAGFNHMHAKRMGPTKVEFARWLRHAETRSLVISYSIAHDHKMVQTYKEFSAIGGWYVDDVQNYTREQLQELYDRIKAIDPTRVADWSGGWRTNLAEIMPTTNVYHRQFYPIRKVGAGRNHERMLETYLEAKKIVQAANKHRVVPCMDLQGVWSETKGKTYWPNARETDLMFYMSIIAGIKGIRWWPYGEVDGTGLWAQAKTIAKEMNGGLSNVFLLGKRTNAAINKHVCYGTWEHNGQVTIIVSNANAKSSHILAVPLPKGSSAVTSQFDYRSSNLKQTGDSLSGTLPPLSIEIYQGTLPKPTPSK